MQSKGCLLLLAAALEGELAAATPRTVFEADVDPCCCKKGPCDGHADDRNWFQHKISGQTWCCKAKENGRCDYFGGYTKKALDVSADKALCTYGNLRREDGTVLEGIACPAHAHYKVPPPTANDHRLVDPAPRCTCDKGYTPGEAELRYKWATSAWTGSCHRVECPDGADRTAAGECFCGHGYQGKIQWKDRIGEYFYEGRCRKVACPEHSDEGLSSGKVTCVCQPGYKGSIAWMRTGRHGPKTWVGERGERHSACSKVSCPKSQEMLRTARSQDSRNGHACECVSNTAPMKEGRRTGKTTLEWNPRMTSFLGTCEPFECPRGSGRSEPLDDCACRRGYSPGPTPLTFVPGRGWMGNCVKDPPPQSRHRPAPDPHESRRTRGTRDGRDQPRGRRPPPTNPSNTSGRTHGARPSPPAPEPEPTRPMPNPAEASEKPSRSCGGGFFDWFGNLFGGTPDEDQGEEPETPRGPPPRARRQPDPTPASERGPSQTRTETRRPRPAPPIPEPEPVAMPPTLPPQSNIPPRGASSGRRANQQVCNVCKAIYAVAGYPIDEQTTKSQLKKSYRRMAIAFHPDKLVTDPHKELKTSWFKTGSTCYQGMVRMLGGNEDPYGKDKDFVDCCALRAGYECAEFS